MVDYSLDHVFQALSDPTRRAILDRLEAGEATVGRLAEPLPVSIAAVSKHIGVLEQAGWPGDARGRERVCRINPTGLTGPRAWIGCHERFWSERLDALDALVGETPGEPDQTRPPSPGRTARRPFSGAPS